VKSLFPAFLKLDGRSVLVVGAGKVAEQKIDGLLSTGARISVVALEASPAVQEWALEGALTLYLRTFYPADLAGVFLAVVATSSRDLNEFVYREAQRQQVLCNVVDVPELCDFFYPAVVRRGDLQIAVSTSGQSPSLAQRIRQQLEQQFGPNYASWVEELGQTRRLVLASDLPTETKQDLLHSLASREAFEAAENKLRAASFELRASSRSAGALAGSPEGNLPSQPWRRGAATTAAEGGGATHSLAGSPQLTARGSEEIA
jgi:precorrin-2 dehydrogenase / sirohydrochlorin ferrochelatase